MKKIKDVDTSNFKILSICFKSSRKSGVCNDRNETEIFAKSK